MPRPSRPWFRVYVETFTDPKVRRLELAHRWLWVAVLAAARRSPLPGVLMLTDRLALEPAELADFAGMDVDQVVEGLDALAALGLIRRNRVGAWTVTNWADRQFESDNVTGRTRRHRAARPEGTGKERSNAVPGNGPETETEAENRDDDDRAVTEAPEAGAGSSSSSDDPLWPVWLAFARVELAERATPPDHEANWLTGVARRARTERSDVLARLADAYPEADPVELARLLRDGHVPPAPPKVFDCYCGAEVEGLDAWQDHRADCDASEPAA